jgi:hypothetical protein
MRNAESSNLDHSTATDVDVNTICRALINEKSTVFLHNETNIASNKQENESSEVHFYSSCRIEMKLFGPFTRRY